MSFDNNVTVGGGHFVDTGSGWVQNCNIPSSDYSGHVVVNGGHMDNPAQLHLANRVDTVYKEIEPDYSFSHFAAGFKNAFLGGSKQVVKEDPLPIVLCGKHKHTKSEHQDKAQEHLKESAKELALAFGSKLAGDDSNALEHGMHSVIEFFKSEVHQWGSLFAPKEHK